MGPGAGWTHAVASEGSSSIFIGSCFFGYCGSWTSDAITVDARLSYTFQVDVRATEGIQPLVTFVELGRGGTTLGEITIPITETLSPFWKTWSVNVGGGTPWPLDPRTRQVKVRFSAQGNVLRMVGFDNAYLGIRR